MKIAGFTIVRNAVKYDYPIIEAIKSILSICNEFIVLVGDSEDETKELIQSINSPKIKIFDSVWDTTIRNGGSLLAIETNKALKYISNDIDWCFYLQADEIVHEKYLDKICQSMSYNLANPNVDGLLFKYLHFFGSYDYIATSRTWYRYEIRAFKNHKNVYSYKDAQGFRKDNNKKLRVKEIDAYIYHYGWVKQTKSLKQKSTDFSKLWHSDEWIEQNIPKIDDFDYSVVDYLELYKGTHPLVMKDRIKKKNWTYIHDFKKNKLSLKNRFKKFALKYFGLEIGYKNYKRV